MISRESLVLLIGLLVLFIPIAGIPSVWKDYLLIGAGFFLILLGFKLRHLAYLRSIDKGNGKKENNSFVENDGDVKIKGVNQPERKS